MQKLRGMSQLSHLSKSNARKRFLCCGLGRSKQNRTVLEGLNFGSHDGEGRTGAAVEEARSVERRLRPCTARAQMRKYQLGRLSCGRGGQGRRQMCPLGLTLPLGLTGESPGAGIGLGRSKACVTR